MRRWAIGWLLTGLVLTTSAQQDDTWIEIRTSRYVVWLYKQPLRWIVFDRHGDELTSQAGPKDKSSLWYQTADGVHHITDVIEEKSGRRETTLICGTTETGRRASVRLSAPRDRAFRIEIQLEPAGGVLTIGDGWRAYGGEGFYGLETSLDHRAGRSSAVSGDPPLPIARFDALNVRGVHLLNETAVRPGAAVLSSTLLVSSRGYGIWVDAPVSGEWDLASRDTRQVAFHQDGARLNYEVFPGDGLPDVIEAWQAASGASWIPPEWAFGPIRRFPASATLSQVEQEIENAPYKAAAYWIPEMLLLERIPEIVEALSAQGARVVMNWSATPPEDARQEMAAKNMLLPGSQVFPDITNQEAKAWYRDRLNELLDAGLAGVALAPVFEPLDTSDRQPWSDGKTTNGVGRGYITQLTEAVQEALNARRRAPSLLLVPWGYNGTAAHAALNQTESVATFSGLRRAVIAVQRAALMGFPVYGVTLTADAQQGGRQALWRALQAGAFFPICAVDVDPGLVLPSSGAAFEEELSVRKMLRWWAETRAALAPYLYALAAEAHETGAPPITPLVVSSGYDGRTLDRWDSFQLGGAFVVAPILEPVHGAQVTLTRQVYLPGGVWRPLWDTLQRIEGGHLFELQIPVMEAPIFVREGAIIPMSLGGTSRFDSGSPLASRIDLGGDRLTMWVIPGADGLAEGAVYNGQRLLNVRASNENGALAVELDKIEEPLALRVLTGRAPKDVLQGSKALAPLDSKDLAVWEEGWGYEPTTGTTWIKADSGARRFRIQF